MQDPVRRPELAKALVQRRKNSIHQVNRFLSNPWQQVRVEVSSNAYLVCPRRSDTTCPDTTLSGTP